MWWQDVFDLSASRTSCVRSIQKRKTSAFAYGPLINPAPSLSKITYKYNYVDLYSGVVFVFFQKRVRVRVKIGFGLGWVLGLGFGIGNLIGGAVGTVVCCARKTPVLHLTCLFRSVFGTDTLRDKLPTSSVKKPTDDDVMNMRLLTVTIGYDYST